MSQVTETSETGAMIGYGMEFACKDVAANGAVGDAYLALAEVYDVTPPSETVDIIDATHSKSPNRTREFIEGLIDPGEVSFEMNFVPGSESDKRIRAQRGKGRIPCQITFPNGSKWQFSGIRTGYEPAAPNEEKMTATVTYKVTSSVIVEGEA